MKLITVRGVHFHIDSSGKKLCRTDIGTSSAPAANTDKTSVSLANIGDVTYIQARTEILERPVDENTRLAASRAVYRSIAIATAKYRKNNQRSKIKKQYCIFFSRFGKCHRGSKCPYIHDPEKVAVCTRFLRGKCDAKDCPFSHNASVHKMPVCLFYLRGACSRDGCPYLHVKVNPDAPVCKDFRNGFCALGEKCKKIHSHVCPSFAVTGVCSRGEKCTMLHRATAKREHGVVAASTQSKSSTTCGSDLSSNISPLSTSPVTSFVSAVSSFPLAAQPSFISLGTSPQKATSELKKERQQQESSQAWYIRPAFVSEKSGRALSKSSVRSGHAAAQSSTEPLCEAQEGLISASNNILSNLSASIGHVTTQTATEASCITVQECAISTSNNILSKHSVSKGHVSTKTATETSCEAQEGLTSASNSALVQSCSAELPDPALSHLKPLVALKKAAASSQEMVLTTSYKQPLTSFKIKPCISDEFRETDDVSSEFIQNDDKKEGVSEDLSANALVTAVSSIVSDHTVCRSLDAVEKHEDLTTKVTLPTNTEQGTGEKIVTVECDKDSHLLESTSVCLPLNCTNQIANREVEKESASRQVHLELTLGAGVLNSEGHVSRCDSPEIQKSNPMADTSQNSNPLTDTSQKSNPLIETSETSDPLADTSGNSHALYSGCIPKSSQSSLVLPITSAGVIVLDSSRKSPMGIYKSQTDLGTDQSKKVISGVSNLQVETAGYIALDSSSRKVVMNIHESQTGLGVDQSKEGVKSEMSNPQPAVAGYIALDSLSRKVVMNIHESQTGLGADQSKEGVKSGTSNPQAAIAGYIALDSSSKKVTMDIHETQTDLDTDQSKGKVYSGDSIPQAALKPPRILPLFMTADKAWQNQKTGKRAGD